MNFRTSFTVDQSPDEVFRAVVDVPRWWTGEVDGTAAQLGDEFVYRYADLHYSRQKVTEVVPGRTVVWRVLDAKLSFTADPAEWTGTDLVFRISPQGLTFEHVGLVPAVECYDQCSSAWGFFINGSLKRLITTGEGPATPPWA
ncbi:SRPBCC domain-containing protein [Actinoplanes sp. NPDC026619]|uniref:SRPBCC family protein n=1 Tax=Actinoplanes sp. NPDC026619 TaxID=3155798 RepID=UPI003409ACF7